MADLRRISSGIAQELGKELEIDEQTIETVRFGMEIIIGAVIKGIVVFGLSYLLGIVPLVTAALVTSGLLRSLSGGAHCTTYSRCLVFGTCASIFNGLLAAFAASRIETHVLYLFVPIIASYGLYVVWKWAPVDSDSKPIAQEKKKKRFKTLSIFFVLGWSLAILLSLSLQVSTELILASIGGFLIQIASLWPHGQRAVNRIDCWLGKLHI